MAKSGREDREGMPAPTPASAAAGRSGSSARPSAKSRRSASPAGRAGAGAPPAASRRAARSPDRDRSGPPSGSHALWEWVRTLAGAFAIYFVVQAFVVQAFRIPSGSMESTLLVGDWLFVNKAIYGPKIFFTEIHLPALSEPKRTGIVVFESPIEKGLNLVKRVIGTAGDTLAMRGGRLIRNGVPQEESYVQHIDPTGDVADAGMARWQREYLVAGAVDPASYRPTRDNWGPIVVPPGRFFMMGDNRDASFDSRYYGFVRRDLIKGKPLILYYSYDPKAGGPLPFLMHIRWSRIGKVIR